ncbi:hypothetical protein GCM10023113_12930 [Cellulomonas oligotrophica]|uniref:Uncharacterized protein n=1 Tax=Cellulomonas oligotrophica TaxID=931536 RepID=A0ABQ4D8C8_9CELL|nr:hypothetical protein Col01nite_11400 [Cellulomonas oligotrophica]
MAGADELVDAGRGDGDAVLAVLDLAGDADAHGGLLRVRVVAVGSAVPPRGVAVVVVVALVGAAGCDGPPHPKACDAGHQCEVRVLRTGCD